jgi:hypothetical protein
MQLFYVEYNSKHAEKEIGNGEDIIILQQQGVEFAEKLLEFEAEWADKVAACHIIGSACKAFMLLAGGNYLYIK